MWSGYPMEEQAAKFYTRAMFSKFQHRLYLSTTSQTIAGPEPGSYFVQLILKDDSKKFLVHYDLTESFSCACNKIQRDKMLCGHALKVMTQLNVYVIPEKYLCDRWTLRGSEHASNALVQADIDEASSKKMKYVWLCKKSASVAAEACKTKEGYELAVKTINGLAEKLVVINTIKNLEQIPSVSSTAVLDGTPVAATLKDPKKKVPRGRPKNSTRLKSSVFDDTSGGSTSRKKRKKSTSNQTC